MLTRRPKFHLYNMEIYRINAEGKRIGRIAAEAAKVLRGKHLVSFRRDRIPEVSVKIENASKLRIDEKKLVQKRYSRYSGYPGGLRRERLEQVQSRLGPETILRHAIHGMLPRNNSRALLMKRVTITK